MEITLLRLEIRRFKGCRALDLELGGKSADIYGDNAAGKTTGIPGQWSKHRSK